MTPLVVRAPNHLGDLLMALPAIEALQPADVVLPRWLVPVMELAGIAGEPVPFDRGTRGLLSAAGELRRRGYRRGLLLAPSFSAALLFALGGVRARRGARTDGRGFLITEPVPDADMVGLHRSATYHVLAFGRVPEPLPAPRLTIAAGLREEWERQSREWESGRAGEWEHAHGERGFAGDSVRSGRRGPETVRGGSELGARQEPDPRGRTNGRLPPAGRAAATDVSRSPALPLSRSAMWARGCTIGLFPGSNAESRRWDTDRFAELARRLAEAGARVVVFGSAGERALTQEVAARASTGARARPVAAGSASGAEADVVAAGAPAVVDAGGRTDLKLLAAGLAACDLLVTNDSGPMHLAAAVGTRTVSLQGPSDPRRTRPLGPGHVLLQHPELACVPCVRNVCPRLGAGTVLPEAQRECLRLIEVADVEAAVRASLAAAG